MTEPFTASLCIFSLLGSKLTTKGIKYLHTYSCLYIYIYTLGTLGYLPTCFLNTFPRESLEPWLEAEAFPHAAARARVAGVWNHGLWATNKGETFCRLYPPVFLLFFFFLQLYFCPCGSVSNSYMCKGCLLRSINEAHCCRSVLLKCVPC